MSANGVVSLRFSGALLGLIALGCVLMTGRSDAQSTDNAGRRTTLPRIDVKQAAAKRAASPTVPRQQARPARRPAGARLPTARGPTAPGPLSTQAPTATQPPLDQPSPITGADLSPSAEALPAATTRIDAGTIYRRPYVSYGDIFRPVGGFNVADYGQGAIGYGLSLRGYTEGEHGRDIAFFIDGVPVNQISSIHTPNYVDLNVLIPETVKNIEIVRGPFWVECGDSNLGGCIRVTTKQSEPFASIGGSGGSFGTARAVATYSRTDTAVQPFLVETAYHTDGYRDNSFISNYNSFNKFTFLQPDGSLWSLRGQAYGTTFGAPGYINRDAVASGALPPTAAVNPTDGGNVDLQNLVANYSSGPTNQELSGVLFAQHDVFNRYADFGGGQRWQHDERSMIGGSGKKVWTGDVADAFPVQLLVGTYWRTDFIDAFQGPSTARVLSGPLTTDVGVTETNLAGYAQLQVKPAPWLKITGAERFDQFFYSVDNRLNPALQPDVAPGVWSPKAGVSIVPVSWLEFYANYGQGFRSPDVPLELLSNPSIQPFKIESKEAGVWLRFDRFTFRGDVWTTESQNESFQAAPGLPVTFLGQARRDGFDLDGRFYVIKDGTSNVSLFANYGGVEALLLNSAPSFFVPNVPVYVANAGIDFNVPTRLGQRLSGEAYATFVGKKYLTQDGLLTTSPFTRWAARLAYSWPDGLTAFTQATWYPGDRLSEFATNFGNVTGASSSDIFTSPVPALKVMAGLTYRMAPLIADFTQPTTKMVVK
jgi:outer membrane receptor protein involved in Fe transport